MALGKSSTDIIRDFFAQYGIDFGTDIETIVNDMLLGGYGPEDIELFLPDIQQTTSFKKRFPGFSQRIANGYSALDLGQYIALEEQYHRIMQAAGLPKGFYDDPSDFGGWIANNVSPDEITQRVRVATDAAQQIDPTMRNLMSQFYGLTTGDIASYFLDQKRALPVIERQYQAAGIATAAARAGFAVTGMSRYEDLLDRGVTAEQAVGAYGAIRNVQDTVDQFAGIYGESFTQQDAEEDILFGNNEKRRRLVSQEQATFGGGSTGSTGSARRQSY